MKSKNIASFFNTPVTVDPPTEAPPAHNPPDLVIVEDNKKRRADQNIEQSPPAKKLKGKTVSVGTFNSWGYADLIGYRSKFVGGIEKVNCLIIYA